MIDYDAQIRSLQNQIDSLCKLRNARVSEAKTAIKRANKEFDRDVLPLHRQIKALEVAQTKQARESTKPTTRQFVKPGTHDPEWSQEDIDHFYELQANAVRATA